MKEDFEKFPFEPGYEDPATKAAPVTKGAAVAERPPQPLPGLPRTATTDIEASRAVQEVQSALVIAKRFPRNEIESEHRISVSCRRYGFAERAFYSYPRGKGDDDGKKTVVRGPSIRMAEMLAQAWGNLDYGFKELERTDLRSIVESYCWDMETNTRAKRTVAVDFKLHLRSGGTKILVDPRDQYELVANYGQRRVRACILEIIPADVVDRAVQVATKTMASGDKSVPLLDRVKQMVQGFADLGIVREKIEARLGHGVQEVNADEMVSLLGIFNSIRDRETKREDWFDYGQKASDGTKAAEMTAELTKAETKK